MINLKTTENSIKLLTKGKYCDDDINVTFEGGSGGGGIEEVTELPVVGEEGKIYKLTEYQLIQCDPHSMTNMNMSTIKVKDFPTENIKTSNVETEELYLYYIENQNDVYLYIDFGNGLEWLTFSYLLELMIFGGDLLEYNVDFLGVYNDKSEIDTSNIVFIAYAIVLAYTYYIYENSIYKLVNQSKIDDLEAQHNDEIENLNIAIESINNELTEQYNFFKGDGNYIHIGNDYNKNGTIRDGLYMSCQQLNGVSTDFDEGGDSTIKKIGKYCFYNSSFGYDIQVENIIRKQKIVEIGDYAFAHCNNLTIVDFTGYTAIPVLGVGVFENCPNLTTIKVPSALLEEWKTATNWSEYADKIVGV